MNKGELHGGLTGTDVYSKDLNIGVSMFSVFVSDFVLEVTSPERTDIHRLD